jgi:hypothetical protein
VGILTGVFSLDGYGCGDVVPDGYVPVAISTLAVLHWSLEFGRQSALGSGQ